MNSFKLLKILASLTALLTLVTSTIGVFWVGNGEAFYVNNIYGNSVQMYGRGLYAYDTYFKAPIQRGTDIVTLCIAIPLLIGILLCCKQNRTRMQLLLAGVLSYFLYYSASLALGVSYNVLFPVYILMFSASLFAFILSILSIKIKSISDKLSDQMPRRGIAVFMIFAGLSVFVWLIEILGASIAGGVPESLAIYTTEPTYVFDLGIIAPAAFTCAILLFRKNPLGYIFAAVLLILNAFIGIAVISQTVFQKIAGVNIPIGAFIAFVGVFIMMSLAASFFTIKLLKNISD